MMRRQFIPRRFRSDQTGSTAVEFAMVAPLFIGLTFSGIELGWTVVQVNLFENAVQNAVRSIYIGESVTRADVIDRVCEDLTFVSDCDSRVTIEAVAISDFDDFPDTDAECRTAGDTTFNPTRSYAPGAGSQIMFIRACLTVDLLTPNLEYSIDLPRLDDGSYAIVAQSAFMNEPF